MLGYLFRSADSWYNDSAEHQLRKRNAKRAAEIDAHKRLTMARCAAHGIKPLRGTEFYDLIYRDELSTGRLYLFESEQAANDAVAYLKRYPVPSADGLTILRQNAYAFELVETPERSVENVSAIRFLIVTGLVLAIVFLVSARDYLSAAIALAVVVALTYLVRKS